MVRVTGMIIVCVGSWRVSVNGTWLIRFVMEFVPLRRSLTFITGPRRCDR